MPKTPTTPHALGSPRVLSPYSRSQPTNAALDHDSTIISHASPALKAEARAAIPPPLLLTKPLYSSPASTGLAVASLRPAENAYYSLSGDFLRSGVFCFSKSGKTAIEHPLDPAKSTGVGKGKVKKAAWLMVQFNVVVKEESRWTCELQMKKHGGLLVDKEMLHMVQMGGAAAERRRGNFVLTLCPPVTSSDPEDDPRLAVSYFLPFSEKLYMQALDGTMPYSFLLSRVTGTEASKGRKRDKLLGMFR